MSEKPRVVVVMPRYGPVEAGAARGFLSHRVNDVELMTFVDSSTSCTPRAFNMCLIHALRLRDEGVEQTLPDGSKARAHATHMAMIHADVEPRRNDWLDVLYREMRIHQAALVSAVIPIKDPQAYRTSTAIGKTDNPWEAARYITPGDFGQLPETFGPDDVCGNDEELLINTGLFLTDLRAPFWDTFEGFQFHNRIVKRDGERIEQFRPEDWELSRHMRRSGAHYVATWAVPVTHHGTYGWANR